MPTRRTGPTGLLTVDSLAARAVGRRSSTRCSTCILPAVCDRPRTGGRPSAGCCARAWSRPCRPTTSARHGPRDSSEPQVMRQHVLRNSIGPALSMTGLQIGLMFAGVLVIEQIFAWPGLGQYTAQSIPVDDFPAIAGVTLVLGIGYVAHQHRRRHPAGRRRPEDQRMTHDESRTHPGPDVRQPDRPRARGARHPDVHEAAGLPDARRTSLPARWTSRSAVCRGTGR